MTGAIGFVLAMVFLVHVNRNLRPLVSVRTSIDFVVLSWTCCSAYNTEMQGSKPDLKFTAYTQRDNPNNGLKKYFKQ